MGRAQLGSSSPVVVRRPHAGPTQGQLRSDSTTPARARLTVIGMTSASPGARARPAAVGVAGRGGSRPRAAALAGALAAGRGAAPGAAVAGAVAVGQHLAWRRALFQGSGRASERVRDVIDPCYCFDRKVESGQVGEAGEAEQNKHARTHGGICTNACVHSTIPMTSTTRQRARHEHVHHPFLPM